LLLSLLPGELQDQLSEEIQADFDFDEELTAFIRFAQSKELGPSTAALVDAAMERDIPFLRLNPYSLVQFGHGKYQKRIQATITSETRHIAVEISCDKEDTHTLLNDMGLPVPQQRVIYGEGQAVRAAERIGYPVVVKPLNANHGRGVSINMNTEEEIRTAFNEARQYGSGRSVLVESYITGFDHRMLVVNGELVAVAKRVPGHVVGDGRSTIEELVEQINQDPRRGIGHEKVLTKLEFDSQAERLLEKANYSRDSVLDEGVILYLRATANLSTGGTAIDVTDVVHPDNRAMAVRAVQAIGLDVGGVDFLTDDITQSYKDVGGAIVEVNAAPGFRMHIAPSEGQARDVSGPVMDMLFPPGTPTRIPIAAITGTNGKTTTSRLLAHILKAAGHLVGYTTTDGVYIDGHLTVKGDMTGPKSAQIVLRDPSVDIAVMETARGGLLRSGLGYTRCDVGACLNVSSDHLGIGAIETLEDLAEVKRIVVEVAQDTAVLNADDPLCLKMADYTEARNVCYVTLNPNHGLVRDHIQAGGRALVLEKGINGDMITIYDNGAHIPLLWTHLIPATLEGKAIHNVQNAMFASAIAYSMGKTLKDIQHGLRTFDTTFFQAPGRMNIYDELPFKVILDYAHNPAAIGLMCNLVAQLDVEGRRICVLAGPGDRRDEDLVEMAATAAGSFDHYICKADDNRRGRGFDEVPVILQNALLANGVAPDCVDVIPDEVTATEAALKMCEPGDLLMVFCDAITRSWKQIIQFDAGSDSTSKYKTVSETVRTSAAEPADTFVLSEGMQLITDERGVRIARDYDEDGD
jgi:cyanophycin synthetase